MYGDALRWADIARGKTEACTMTKDAARMTRAGSLPGESADEEVARLRGCLNDPSADDPTVD